ncbi:MAG: hypothetical protein AVDCRST_MAG03-3167, partial [uncultured Rubrobacteraceae bacterium]
AGHRRLRHTPHPHKLRHPLLRRLRPDPRRQGPARRHRPHLRARHPRHSRHKDAPDRHSQPRRRLVPAAGL